MPKKLTLLLTVLLNTLLHVQAQESCVVSPNGRASANLLTSGKGYILTVGLDGKTVIPSIGLGINFSDGAFAEKMRLVATSEAQTVTEHYTTLHGKRSDCQNRASEVVYGFVNEKGQKLALRVRAYDDGITFRYEREDVKEGTIVDDELTAYTLLPTTKRWMQRFVTSYEGPFPLQTAQFPQGEWGYPALLNEDDCWALLTEANMGRGYCATKLSNQADRDTYKLTFPAESDGCGTGAVKPAITGSWHTPWRVIVMGGLKDIVASTLVEDVSQPRDEGDWSWVKPGRAAWVYWAYNRGSKDFQLVCKYADLAKAMGWEYLLIDWEWDVMGNGGRLEDAVNYARSLGVKVLMWYNSGGKHNYVEAGPKDRLITHEARMKEFQWLKEIGVSGIKVDFFESDKQEMINYYIDILEDAAPYQLLVNFHGCTIPRGWSRTYPHLMSMEAIYGAEQYNNAGEMTKHGAEWNTVFPFTRNVVGPMDYTPVAFTDSQHPHTTTNAHELALSVAFESGILHFADRPEGFLSQTKAVKDFLSRVPVAWNDTRLLSGYPGESIVIARRKGNTWYIAGLNGTDERKMMTIDMSTLSEKVTEVTLFRDDATGKGITAEQHHAGEGIKLQVECLPRGGFVIVSNHTSLQ